jgi:hypothetical protein
MNISTRPVSNNIDAIRKTGEPVKFEDLIRSQSNALKGAEFRLEDLAKVIIDELEMGTLVACKEYGWFFFDPEHEINKFGAENTGLPTFQDLVESGEMAAQPHTRYLGFR